MWNPRSTLDLLNQNMHFKKILGELVCIKFVSIGLNNCVAQRFCMFGSFTIILCYGTFHLPF